MFSFGSKESSFYNIFEGLSGLGGYIVYHRGGPRVKRGLFKKWAYREASTGSKVGQALAFRKISIMVMIVSFFEIIL